MKQESKKIKKNEKNITEEIRNMLLLCVETLDEIKTSYIDSKKEFDYHDISVTKNINKCISIIKETSYIIK